MARIRHGYTCDNCGSVVGDLCITQAELDFCNLECLKEFKAKKKEDTDNG